MTTQQPRSWMDPVLVVVDEDGNEYPRRRALKLAGVDIADDEDNDTTTATVTPGPTLGTGVAAFLAAPSPANFAGALTGPVTVAKGGTGLAAPGAAGNVLTSDGTAWGSATPWAPSSRITPLDIHHIHAWELTDVSGNFADTGSSASKVNLTAAGSGLVYGAPGIVGSCVQFGLDPTTGNTGTAGGASVLTSAFSDLPAGSCTLEAWVCSYVGKFDFIAGANPVGTGCFELYGGVGVLTGTVSGHDSSGGGHDSFQSPSCSGLALPPAFIWQHVAIVYASGTFAAPGSATLYLNGELVSTHSAYGALRWTDGTTPKFMIGLEANNTGQFWGKMSRVRMSDIARTQTELRAAFQKGMGY